MASPEAEKALQQAKVQLMMKPDSAFFTTVCFSLRLMWDETCRTAATNGTKLFINPDFFMGLSVEERIFVLLHESMHVAFLHMQRLQERNQQKWNVAADHVINLMLIERGYRMPKGGLANQDYRDLSTEEVYKLIPDEESDFFNMDLLAPEGDPAELQREVEDILVRAQLQSQMENDKPGTIPGEVQIFLNGLLKPKLPWHRILAKHIRQMSKADYTFKKLNRRYFPEHLLPSLHSEKLIDLAIAVDASGSVSDDEFKQFVSEMHCILRMMKPEKITVLTFDASLRDVSEVKNLKELSQVNFTGRGGTQIHPVMEWARANHPQMLLVFTDGDFHFYDRESPSNETLWLIHNNPGFSAPYGKVIHYEV